MFGGSTLLPKEFSCFCLALFSFLLVQFLFCTFLFDFDFRDKEWNVLPGLVSLSDSAHRCFHHMFHLSVKSPGATVVKQNNFKKAVFFKKLS